jgi:tRNA(His) 5'-end guanylyltransferase
VARQLELKRPFDERFNSAMVSVCRDLIAASSLNCAFAFTFSDEISIYLPDLPFGGRVEKIDSVCAAFAASSLTIALSLTEPIAFDARIVQVGGDATGAYLSQRQQEAWRNHMNAYCQQALIGEGLNPTEAAEVLKGMSSARLHEMMFGRGINLAKTPAWERRGVMVYKKEEKKEGFNPLSGEMVMTTRTVLVTDWDLPLFTSPQGKEYLASLIGT